MDFSYAVRVTTDLPSINIMGICLQDIKGAGPKMKTKIARCLETGFVWLVCRRDPVIPKNKTQADYHIQGVTSEEKIAVEMCEDEHYFIGPLPLNTALPHDTIEWVGLYFPLGPNPYNK